MSDHSKIVERARAWLTDVHRGSAAEIIDDLLKLHQEREAEFHRVLDAQQNKWMREALRADKAEAEVAKWHRVAVEAENALSGRARRFPGRAEGVGVMDRLRLMVYQAGFHPKRGSIWWSPSLHLMSQVTSLKTRKWWRTNDDRG